MAVEPERRYPTADALCADLVAFLEGRPVTAHPPTRTYLATKFVRRHRVEATLVTLVLLALVIGLFATTWQYGRTQDALKALGVQKGKAESSAVAARRMEALATQRAEEAEWQSYVSSLSAATMAMSAFERPLAERELRRIPESRRGWECEVLLDLIAERGRRVLAADKSAGHGIGRMLLAPDCARLWTTPEYVRNGAPVSPFVCWDLQGDRELGQWSSSPGDRDAQLVQSADQRRVIGFSKGRVRIWDVLTAQLVHDLTIDLPGVRAVAGHPRQNEFAIAFSLPAGGIGVLDGHALEESRELVWKYRWVGDGSERSRPASDTAPIVDALAYSPDGTWLACAGSSLFNVRDSATFEARYAFQASKMMGHLIAWDPRGQWLAHVDADSVVGLVNAQSWRTVHHLSAHEDIVTGIGYLEGGRVLVSAGRDATVRLWDVDKQRQLGRLMASAQVRQLCVDDHRRQVITIEGRNGIWQRDCSEVLRASPITGRLVGGGFLGDSSSAVVAVTSPSARVSVIDASTGAETLRLDPARRCTASWYSACVSPDRSKIAFVACEPRVHLGYLTSDVGGTDGDKTSNPLAWRATASSPEYAEAGRNASWSIGPEPIAFGKNGATVFVGSREGVVVAINSESGEIMARRVLDAPGVLDLDVAASRDLLAVVALSGKVVVLRSEGLAIVEEFFGREVGSPTAVAWIDNDRRLAIGRADGQVVAVDLGSRSIVRLDKSHAGSVSALEFLASASRLVSISLDGAIRVWDCARAECIVAIPARPGDGGYALIASPDSLSIGVGYSNGQWRVLKPESAGVADR